MANDKTTKYLAKGGTFTGLKTGFLPYQRRVFYLAKVQQSS